MKRSCLIIALMFAVVSAGWANMLTSPGFETGGGWLKTGNTFTEPWAPRTASTGMVFHGWEASPAGFSQEVAAVSGTYTFTIWACREINYLATSTDLRIEWLNAAGVSIQATTVANYTALPNDSSYHQIFVSGTCTSSDLARVRVSVNGSWTIGSGACSFMFDDADLYSGPYAGNRLSNGGFEYNGAWRGGQWNGVTNLYGFGQGGQLGQDWANHSGTSGVSALSWDATMAIYSNTFWQNVNPVSGTGTYTFAIWVKREANAWFSNAVMTIQWYDTSFTNKVQNDSVANLGDIPNDGNWHEYAVQGVCTSPALYEARVLFGSSWYLNPGVDPRSTMIDDARFLPVPYSEMTNSLVTDWCYHNSLGYNARSEQVPGTNVGSFLQVNPATTTVTFYVLGNSPSQAKFYPVEDNKWEIRTSWLPPTNLATWVTTYSNMTRLGDVVIPSGTPFHGVPSVGSQTVALWKCVWPMPANPSGVPYTNHLQVFYSPFTKTTSGPMETGYTYLGRLGGWVTNNLGQQLVIDPVNHDYVFDVNPVKWAAFTNGSFEQPVPVASTLDDTGWGGYGDVGREVWAGRTGSVGVAFRTWNAGAFELYQDIATTGGTYQFSGWIQPQTGAAPVALEIAMEWYDKSGSLVQENKQELIPGLYEEFEFTRIGVVGSCAVTNLDYVRVLLAGQYNVGTEASATMIDDMEFVSVGTNLLNGGFETGFQRDIRDWYGVPPYFAGYGAPPRITEIHEWALRSGSNGLAFHGWEEALPRYEAQIAQPIAASTGTYVYSVWIRREINFINLTNTELRLEWYGGNYPSKLQADTVAKITPPNDNNWAQYTMTGTCNNASVRFVQPVLLAQWDMNPNADQRSFMIDDISLVLTNGVPGETYTDGIPDSWWAQYSMVGGDRTATGDFDNDGYLNIEEYAGDTVPTNNVSYFPRATNVLAPRNVMAIIVNPSSAARMYDAYWKTNLMDYATPWQSYGLVVQGNGAAVTLTVTNDDVGGKRFFRTGAKLP